MEPILIPCPQCGKGLKLRDHSLLGKRGKCPQCQHRFRLEEPDEVELELADDEAPVTGTSARWVPDEPPTSTPAVATAKPETSGQPKTTRQHNAGEQPASAKQTGEQIPNFDAAPSAGTASRLKSPERQKQKQIKLWITIGSTVSGMVLAVLLSMALFPNRSEKRSSNGDDGRYGNQSRSDAGQTAGGSPNGGASSAVPGPPAESLPQEPAVPPTPPPPGKPVVLKHIPLGARLIIHLRPAELWEPNSQAETVRLCLGPVGVWTEETLKELLLFEPAKIEEALICLYLDDKTQPPKYAYWVKLTEPLKSRSAFLQRFQGRPETQDGVKIYLTDSTADHPNRAFRITDPQGGSFASAPAFMASEMILAEKHPGLPNGGLEGLLKHTDRNRHLTVLFNPRDLRDFRQHLFPEEAHNLLEHFLVRLEDEKVESAAWSFHLGSEDYPDLYTELVLRNRTSISPRELQLDMYRKFRNLPDELMQAVRKMEPSIMAERQLVSRLPVMLKAYSIETVPEVGSENERYLKLITALPKVAGPNLAAAGMLTWRLAQTTDFSRPAPSKTGPKLPRRVADRLKLKIEVDFRRLPLQEAFQYIATETHTKMEIDGDALKDAAYTKNMPQTFKLSKAPATKAIHEILKKYDKMVIVVDEKNRRFIVTTKKFADMKGLKPFPIRP